MKEPGPACHRGKVLSAPKTWSASFEGIRNITPMCSDPTAASTKSPLARWLRGQLSPVQPMSVPALPLSSRSATELLSIQCSLLINIFPTDPSFFPCGTGKFLRALHAVHYCCNKYEWQNYLNLIMGQPTSYP